MRTPAPLLPCLLLWCLFLQAHCDCILSYYPRRTTYGTIRAQLDTPNSPQGQPQARQGYVFPLVERLDDAGSARAAVAVSKFSMERRSQQFGYNITAKVADQDGTAVLFELQVIRGSGNSQWVYLEWNFFISQANELVSGIANVEQLSPIANTNNLRVSQAVQVPTVSFNFRASVRIFISGLQIQERNQFPEENVTRLEQTIASIRALKNFGWNAELIRRFSSVLLLQKSTGVTISETTLINNRVIQFQVETNQAQLRSLSFSYLIFLQRLGQQNMYKTVSGSFTTSDQTTFVYDSLYYDDMKMYGLSGIRYSLQNISAVGLDIDVSSNDRNQKLFKATLGEGSEFNVSFFGISVIPGSVCLSCPNSPIIFQGFCVSDCPRGYVLGVNSDGSFICIQCNIEGFFIPGQDGKTCICAQGNFLVVPTQTCELCPYDCQTCNGNRCLTCDIINTFRVLNQTTARCDCPTTAFFDDVASRVRRCIRCNQRCQTCRGGRSNECVTCVNRRVLENGFCRCPQGYIENQLGQCVCTSPYSLNPAGQCALSEGRCRDNETLTVVNGQRTCSCRPGFFRNLLTNWCTPECQIFQSFSYSSSSCECLQGYVRNETSRVCYDCRSRLNQLFNSVTQKCECMQGFSLNNAGECAACPPRMVYEGATNSCECVFNYYKVGNTCVKCTGQEQHPSCRVVDGGWAEL